MRKIQFILVTMFLSLLLTSCNRLVAQPRSTMQTGDYSGHTMTGGHGAMMQLMHGNTNIELVAVKGAKQPLAIPAMLQPDSVDGNNVRYTLTAQNGFTSFKEGASTATTGYNGSFLGPIVKVKQGQNITIKAVNQLAEPTSYHWHGLEIAGVMDGGVHSPIAAGQTKQVNFKVEQPAATLWFHPHAMGFTASQVYSGLAGLLYVEDEQLERLAIPKTHGVDDIPVILQDRTFNKDNQLNYESVYQADGVLGDTMLINGTINPYFDVTTKQLRLRLLNGSNARNYQLHLSNKGSLLQIASDGGLLAQPVSLNSIFMGPGERYEVILDFSNEAIGKTVSLMMDNFELLTFNIKAKQDNTTVNNQTVLTTLAPLLVDTKAQPDRTVSLKGMMHMVSINGRQFDVNRIDFKPSLGSTEIWQVTNDNDGMMGGMIHPFHVHGVQFRVLSRDGKEPPTNERGWKDTINLEVGEKVLLQVSYKNLGTFMYHCHNLEHEEQGMMAQFSVV